VSPTARIGALALTGLLVVAAPAAAGNGRHGPGMPGSGTATPSGAPSTGTTSPSTGASTAQVPSRVRVRVNRVNRSLERAAEKLDDGDNTAGIAALKAVERNVASAWKAAKRRATDSSGPAAVAAVAGAQHQVVIEVAALYDGVTENTVIDGLSAAAKAALDGRDDLIATVGGLTAEQKAGYGALAQTVSSDVTAEQADVAEALSDDTLKDPEAKAALNAIASRLAGQATGSQALVASVGAGTTTTPTAATTTPSTGVANDRRGEDCPEGEPGSGSSSPSTETAQQSRGPGRFGQEL
jgi:hypothetical protein